MNRSEFVAATAPIAWFRKTSTVRRVISAWATVVVLLVAAVGMAQASPPAAASGTFTQIAPTGFDIQFPGPNVLIKQTTVGRVSGTLDGAFEDSLRVMIHPNGRFTAQNTIACRCEVDGREGVLTLRVVNTGEQVSPDTATFAGRAVITGGTSELSGLRGVFDIAGSVDQSSGLATWTYSGQIHFRP